MKTFLLLLLLSVTCKCANAQDVPASLIAVFTMDRDTLYLLNSDATAILIMDAWDKDEDNDEERPVILFVSKDMLVRAYRRKNG